MNIEAAELFCDVAHHRSVSRAAELHGITQSAASQRLQSLEREVGVPLIDRSHRPLSLTAAGDVYQRGCRRILDGYTKLLEQIRCVGKGPAASATTGLRGEVTIAAIYSSGIDLLNQIKAGFEEKNPQTEIHIEYLQPDAVYDAVRHEQCDFGILSYPQKWAGLASIPLREEVMGVVVRGGHELSRKKAIHASDLEHYELAGFDLSLPIGRQIRKYMARYCPEAQVVNQFDNIDTIKTVVEQSDTAAILPLRTVQREVQSGTLAAITLNPPLARPLGIVYMRSHTQKPLVKMFIEYLLKNQPAKETLRPEMVGAA